MPPLHCQHCQLLEGSDLTDVLHTPRYSLPKFGLLAVTIVCAQTSRPQIGQVAGGSVVVAVSNMFH